jgi:hypothetical protein
MSRRGDFDDEQMRSADDGADDGDPDLTLAGSLSRPFVFVIACVLHERFMTIRALGRIRGPGMIDQMALVHLDMVVVLSRIQNLCPGIPDWFRAWTRDMVVARNRPDVDFCSLYDALVAPYDPRDPQNIQHNFSPVFLAMGILQQIYADMPAGFRASVVAARTTEPVRRVVASIRSQTTAPDYLRWVVRSFAADHPEQTFPAVMIQQWYRAPRVRLVPERILENFMESDDDDGSMASQASGEEDATTTESGDEEDDGMVSETDEED